MRTGLCVKTIATSNSDGDVRRRRWTSEQKLTIIEQSSKLGETVSSTARRHGVAPNFLYRWRRLLSEGGAAAVDSDEPVIGNSEVKKLEDRVRELGCMLGRKTMVVEILREALSKADSKKCIRGRSCCGRTVRYEGGRRRAGRLPFLPR
nr:transposase [Agrobacterium tumefaciens]